jgi:hypothetical protein
MTVCVLLSRQTKSIRHLWHLTECFEACVYPAVTCVCARPRTESMLTRTDY